MDDLLFRDLDLRLFQYFTLFELVDFESYILELFVVTKLMRRKRQSGGLTVVYMLLFENQNEKVMSNFHGNFIISNFQH